MKIDCDSDKRDCFAIKTSQQDSVNQLEVRYMMEDTVIQLRDMVIARVPKVSKKKLLKIIRQFILKQNGVYLWHFEKGHAK